MSWQDPVAIGLGIVLLCVAVWGWRRQAAGRGCARCPAARIAELSDRR